MLTRALALEWARDKVRVVAVTPGKIDTDLVKPIVKWVETNQRELNPQGRIGKDAEVAELVAYLASDASPYITGISIPIDGGELLSSGG